MAQFLPVPDLQRVFSRMARGKVTFSNGAGAPSDGVTGAGTADKYDIYLRTSNDIAYVNTGTKASPIWTPIVH